MSDPFSRMTKFRALAEHPRTDPCEAAVARQRLEELRALYEVLYPGDAGYYDWARALQVGDRVEIRRPGEHLGYAKITRQTSTQHILEDGSRFRRTGDFPGYRTGESGRHGRTYIVRIVFS